MESLLSRCPFAVQCLQEQRQASVNSPLLSDAVREFLASRVGYSPVYVTSLRQYLNMFARNWTGLRVGQVERDHLDTWFYVRGEGPEVLRSNLGRLAAFFGWARSRGYILADPCAQVVKPRLIPRVPKILKVSDVRRVFEFFQARKDWPMLLYCTLAFFVGMRPSEIHRLDKVSIDTTAKRVFISAQISKVHRSRFAPIPANALEWLNLCDCDIPSQITVKRRKALVAVEWPQDAARHTAATFILARDCNAAATALGLGNSEKILLLRYAVPVGEKDCKDYWSIRPRQAQCELWAA